MLHRTGSTRPGVTLLEVLTAIFIMAIGMLALLTLFPVGALSMARAVRDQRAATIAANADALASAIDLRNDTNVTTALSAGHPVFVDPHYQTIGAGNVGAYTIGAVVSPGITRITPASVTTPQLVARFFTFQDEIEFDSFGAPINRTSGGVNYVNRPGTYTLAYLIRRPDSSRSDLPELTVVVFAQRNLDIAEGETNMYQGAPGIASVAGSAGTNTINIQYTGTAPEIRLRSWILDTTLNSTTGKINGFFYRVESVNETTIAGNPALTLEVDRPLKENVQAIVHFRDIIAALDRGTTWVP